ncbi:hypothetical protein [Streptomyces ziwulingensis]|uniref:Uncharacterized protein n=1 Tax=Streptomyces ziwulingensis TaxID=1045501 RepID=A0ABP9AZS4_9ACTN
MAGSPEFNPAYVSNQGVAYTQGSASYTQGSASYATGTDLGYVQGGAQYYAPGYDWDYAQNYHQGSSEDAQSLSQMDPRDSYELANIDRHGKTRTPRGAVPQNVPALPEGYTRGVYNEDSGQFYAQSEAGALARYNSRGEWVPSDNKHVTSFLNERAAGPAIQRGSSQESLSSAASNASYYNGVSVSRRSTNEPVPADAPHPPAGAEYALYDVEAQTYLAEGQGAVMEYPSRNGGWGTVTSVSLRNFVKDYGKAIEKFVVGSGPTALTGIAKLAGPEAEKYANVVGGGFQVLHSAYSLGTNIYAGLRDPAKFDPAQAWGSGAEGTAGMLNASSYLPKPESIAAKVTNGVGSGLSVGTAAAMATRSAYQQKLQRQRESQQGRLVPLEDLPGRAPAPPSVASRASAARAQVPDPGRSARREEADATSGRHSDQSRLRRRQGSVRRSATR